MAWDVHDADLAAARKPHVRESEVDRHATPLLFGEAIWIDAGQRRDEGGLAMVDVPGSAYNEVRPSLSPLGGGGLG
jgi:hypothetical protein